MSTVIELQMARLERNKDKKLVRDLSGKEYVLGGIQLDEKKLALYMGIINGFAKYELRPFRGYLFFCQICERWRGMKSLSFCQYPYNVVCVDCIDHRTHEVMEAEQAEAEKQDDNN